MSSRAGNAPPKQGAGGWTASDLIRLLELEPLPGEGGFFREIYRSRETLEPSALPKRFQSARTFSTSIYYLLTPETTSAIHRLTSDEVFHFYLGDPVEMLQLFPGGASRRLTLGREIAGGHHLQVVVPHGVWQGSRLVPGGAYALLGTTVAPGFDFQDYETGDVEALAREYAQDADLIRMLGRVLPG